MAVQYAFSQITTTGLKLAVDAADPLSYPGSGTSWTDVTGNGFTGTVSSSISFATTFRGALVSSNSSSAVSFSGSAADFGAGSFTVEMAFSPSVINGTHWLYSKNSGSFPNFGAFITGSGGSGRLTAFYNVSSTISSSATTAIGSIVTGSNYIVDVTYAPLSLFTSVYLNSDLVSNVGANGSGSLSTSASLLLLNNTTASNSGTVGNLYNFKVYNPFIGSANIRKNYNSMCSRFGLPLALYTPPAPLLLDLYPGAAAAYSLRRLSDFYGGSAIQVRRSSDNAVLDIGFDGDGSLNTGALLSFCGVGNGFVTTWYDQSGNGRNATQATAANQPQIVSAGSVLTLTGVGASKPCLSFDGINDSFGFTSITAPQFTTFYPSKKLINADLSAWFTRSNIGFGAPYSPIIFGVNGAYIGNNIKSTNSSTYQNNNYILMSGYINSSNDGFIQINNASITLGATFVDVGSDIFNSINNRSNSQYSKCDVPEMIFYNFDNSANITAINLNINSYYSIY